ncbi:MAG: SusC/RagA family TonB-linked outer membrane protein [Prolixibacteraceae bacterium]
MKITLFILFLAISSTFAKSSYSQNTRFSIHLSNAPIQKIFEDIQKKSEFIILYRDDQVDLQHKSNVDFDDATVDLILDKAFEGLNLSYKIFGRQIVISTKKGNDEPSLVGSESVASQKKEINGKVTDSKGQPMPGVVVAVKGTTIGIISDNDGKFTLKVAESTQTLVFSFLGMKTQEISITGKTEIKVAMVEQLVQVDEVLVTGYQTIAKERTTGAFSTIKLEQIDKPVSNIAQRLIGTTAGVQARLDNDGNPTFEIRGQTSLNATKDPLVVIDGFPTEKGFSSINPNDVESITVLKDAAAASIWGAKAANGVFVITSKKVTGNQPLRISVNTFYKVGQKVDMNYVNPKTNSNDMIDYELLSFNKWGNQPYAPVPIDGSYSRTYSPTQMLMWDAYFGKITTAQRDAGIAPYRSIDNTQQIEDNLLANPTTQQYNITMMGGTEKISNFLSVLHEKNQSNYQQTFNTRDVLSFRNTAKMFKWLELETGAVLAFTNASSNGITLSDISSLAPYEMLLDNSGNYTNIPYARNMAALEENKVPLSSFPYKFTYNPIEEINNRAITSKSLDTRITAALFLKPMKGLTFESRVQYEFNNTFDKSIYNENTATVRNLVNGAASWNRATNVVVLNLPKGGFLDQSRSDVKALTVRNQLNFNKTFGKHDVSALAGFELSDRIAQSFGNPRTYGYDDTKLSVGTFPNGPGGATVKLITNWLGTNQTFAYVNSFSYATRRYYSSYANASYSYNSKYTLSGSVRSDASNFITDDPKYRYAPFWSVGAAWHASREEFIQSIDWIDRLSARLTFGYNGNVDVTTSFQPLISPSATVNTNTQEGTTAISSLGNPTLRWEKTGTWNGGTDFSLFKGKLNGTLDVYRKYTRDLIASISIPSVNGSTSSKMNNAEMKNTGFELTLGTSLNLVKNDIVWRGSANFSYNKNVITKLFAAQIAASSMYGKSIGTGTFVQGYNSQEMWSFLYAGIKNEGTTAVPNFQPQVQGPGTTTYNFTGLTPGDGRDYMLHMGTKVAPYTFGFTNYFKIYDFSLSFIVTGKFGHVFSRQSFNYPVWWTGRVLPNQKLSEVMNGDPMKIVPLPQNIDEPKFYFWDRFYPYMSYLVESASHLRMQEINLTYNVPQKYTKKLSLSLVQLYVQCNDLFTVHSNKYGEDPEYLKGVLIMKPQPKFTFGLKFDL